MLIELVIGDASGDGHDKRESVIIDSNLTPKQLREAYSKGKEIIGEDFTDWCKDFEANTVPAAKMEKILQAINIKPGELFADYDIDEDGDYCVSMDNYDRLYLSVAKLGDPTFVYSDVNISSLNIGGYGLFYG